MNVSVILPTRGRCAALRRSIESLRKTATDASSFEVLLALDDDDRETLDQLERNPIPASRLLVGRRVGYVNLHHYVNALCSQATGDWLFLWNDDVLMETENWDGIIASYTGRFLLLNPDSNHNNQAIGNCPFPLLPRRWFELLGHVAMNNHFDTWAELVAKQLGIMTDIPVCVLHDRFDLTGGNDDQTARERVFTTSTFFGPEVQAMIREDAVRLREQIHHLR